MMYDEIFSDGTFPLLEGAGGGFDVVCNCKKPYFLFPTLIEKAHTGVFNLITLLSGYQLDVIYKKMIILILQRSLAP